MASNIESAGAGISFLYDATKPTSTIVGPTNNSKLNTMLLITGNAADYPTTPSNAGLNTVKFSIKRVSDTQYWRGAEHGLLIMRILLF